METVMLAFSKQILKSVSFDKRLFWKEYRKVSRRMDRRESNRLREWIKKEYLQKSKEENHGR